MSYTVDPAELDRAGTQTDNIGAGLDEVGERGVEGVVQVANQLYYQRAAGMAEAVGQKAGASLSETAVALRAMAKGYAAAATVYREAEDGVAAEMHRANGPR